MAPVRVYLDNQDFSRLYNPPNQQLSSIAEELLDLASSGTATFHYSYWHIFEFLQPAKYDYLPDRRARASFLKKLCGSNSLPFFHDILDGEQAIDGVWLPVSFLRQLTIDLRSRMDAKLNEKKANRHMRRIAHSGRAWRVMVNHTFPGNSFERSIKRELGLTDEFIRAAPMSRFIRGQISEEALRIMLGRMFCDPTFFFEAWFVQERRENPIRQQSIAIGRQWIEIVEKMRLSAKDYAQKRTAAKKARRHFYDVLRSSGLPDSLKRIASEKLTKIPPPLDFDALLNSSGIGDGRLRYLECYIKFHLAEPQRKPTDVVDMMHLFYTQSMDLIRCDRAIFAIMKTCPHLPTDHLVGTITELPDRIRNKALG